MSREYNEKITCPDCGTEGEFVVWESLNTIISPEAKDKLITGELFRYKCPKCGKTHCIDYGMLYHDMSKHVMIHYCHSEKNYNEMLEIYSGKNNVLKEMHMDDNVYAYRIVRNQNSLREKAMLLDEGLDDRVVEMIKLFYLAQLQNRAEEISAVLFERDKEGWHIVFLTSNNSTLSASFDKKLYDNVEDRFSKYFPQSREENLEVDRQYALDVFNKIPK